MIKLPYCAAETVYRFQRDLNEPKLDKMKKRFDIRFTFIRIIACMVVVLLHTLFVSFTLYQQTISPADYKVTQSIVHNLMWAVPAFVMVTGALLLNPARKVSFKKLFSVYIRRVLVALVIGCVVFRIIDAIWNHEPFSGKIIGEGLKNILTGQTWGHMWYLYLLIGLYLLMPFYKKIAEHCTKRELYYLLVVYFVFESLLLLFNMTDTTVAFYIHVSSIYPFYLFAGYVLNNEKRPHAGVFAVVFIAATALLVLLTIVRIDGSHDKLETLFGYSSPVVVFQSLGFFGMMLGARELKSNRITAVLKDIDNASFGIYLLHLGFVRWLLRYHGWNPYENKMLFIAVFLIAFFGSYLIVTAFKHIMAILKSKRGVS